MYTPNLCFFKQSANNTAKLCWNYDFLPSFFESSQLILLISPKSSMPFADLLWAWSPTFADSLIPMAKWNEWINKQIMKPKLKELTCCLHCFVIEVVY